jgi:hypothetical protein
MDNPEKLATLGIHDEEKQIKNTIRHELSYKQLGLKTNRPSFAEIVTYITTRNSERKDI